MNNKSAGMPFNNLLECLEYHEESGEIQIGGTDWILMAGPFFRDLVGGIEGILGSGAAVVWLEAGKKAGRNFSEALLREAKKPEEIPNLMETFFTNAGWGRIRTKIDFDKKEAVVTIRNSATSRKTESKEPVCHIIRGYIAGVCDVIFGELMECFETKCSAKGDSLCEFRIKKKL
jgi:predicted hydrocarbon binding protein